MDMRTIYGLAVGIIATGMLTAGVAHATFLMPAVPSMPALQTIAEMQMTVSSKYANLREKPTTSSKILEKLNNGTKVDVIGKVAGGKWAHVKVDNMEGYISTKLLM